MKEQKTSVNTNKIYDISNLIKFATSNSVFYREKYSMSTKTIIDYEDLGTIPFTESFELANSIPPYKSLTNVPKGSYVFTTGGSTGEPKLIFLTSEELETNISFHGYGYRKAGITNNDIVGTFGVPGYLTSEFTVYLGLQHTGCLIVPLGINSDPEKLLYYLKLFNVNTLLVMPSDLIPLLQYIESTGESLSIEKVIYGGEKMYESTKEYIKKSLNVKHFGSVFQSMDVGTIGYQCESCGPGEYHLQEELQFAEILDDNCNLVQPGDIGELVITNLNRKLMPVIRYRTNDLALLLGRECECGSSHVKFQLLGRKGDLVKIGGEKFSLSLINTILEQYSGLTGIYQIDLLKENGLDKLLVKVEKGTSNALTEKQVLILESEIRETILKNHQKLRSMLENGVIAPIDIVLTDRSNLITSPTSGKVKVICDLRK